MRGEVVSVEVREETEQILQRELEAARQEAEEQQEENDLLQILEALEDPESFSLEAVPLYLREQFEEETKNAL